MTVLVLSCSLNTESRSRHLATMAADRVRAHGAEVDLMDLAEGPPLPLCDGGTTYEHPSVVAAIPRLQAASAILLAVPVYNYDVNAAAKNLLELTGYAWRGKVVGFICAAGGQGSFMAPMSFANSLMLDFRCFILPRFVYAPFVDVADKEFGEAAIARRVDELAAETVRVATVLAPPVG